MVRLGVVGRACSPRKTGKAADARLIYVGKEGNRIPFA